MLWTTTEVAPELPAGWEAKMSASKGAPYYYNKSSNSTTWKHPGLAAASTRRGDPKEEPCAVPRHLPVASVEDAPAVPECLLSSIDFGTFPVMLKANTPAGSVVGVKISAGFPCEGRLVSVLVPEDTPTNCCFWIIAPFPKAVMAITRLASSCEASDSWSSSAGSAAPTLLHDAASSCASDQFEFDSLEDCPDDAWDFEKYEDEVRATARAARALKAHSLDWANMAPEEAAAPAILLSRTPSPQELHKSAENPFRKQLQLQRCAASHNDTLSHSSSLPTCWERKMSTSKGKPYYYNASTRETTWVLPTE